MFGGGNLGPIVARIATAGLTLVLFLIGLGLSRSSLRSGGWQAALQGILLWFFISTASLLVIIGSTP